MGVLGMEFLFETFEVMVGLPSAARSLSYYWIDVEYEAAGENNAGVEGGGMKEGIELMGSS